MAKSYSVNVEITDGDKTMTVSSGRFLSGTERLKDTITNILENHEDGILETFPTNQWIYQWIISSEIYGSLEGFFTDFNVNGDRQLMDALLHGLSVSDSAPKNGVLVFNGY